MYQFIQIIWELYSRRGIYPRSQPWFQVINLLSSWDHPSIHSNWYFLRQNTMELSRGLIWPRTLILRKVLLDRWMPATLPRGLWCAAWILCRWRIGTMSCVSYPASHHFLAAVLPSRWKSFISSCKSVPCHLPSHRKKQIIVLSISLLLFRLLTLPLWWRCWKTIFTVDLSTSTLFVLQMYNLGYWLWKLDKKWYIPVAARSDLHPTAEQKQPKMQV